MRRLINAHNLQYIRDGAIYALSHVFKEENGKKIGGITGDILGNWLHVFVIYGLIKGLSLVTILVQELLQKHWKIQLKRKVPNMLRWILLAFKPCLLSKAGFEIFGTLENYPISDKKYYLNRSIINILHFKGIIYFLIKNEDT